MLLIITFWVSFAYGCLYFGDCWLGWVCLVLLYDCFAMWVGFDYAGFPVVYSGFCGFSLLD